MGKAEACGEIVVKDQDGVEIVLRALKDYKVFQRDDEIEERNGLPIIYVSCDMQPWREDDIHYFYNEIAEYVVEADIRFMSEDRQFWVNRCKDGIWTELQGEVTYDETTSKKIAEPGNSLRDIEAQQGERE